MFVAVQNFAMGTDSTYTARDAAMAVKESFADKSHGAIEPQLAIVFMGIPYDHKAALKAIKKELGRHVIIIGCTTAGEIDQSGPIKQSSIAIMLLGSDTLSLYATVEKRLESNSTKAGRSVGKTITKKLKAAPSLMLTFADGLTAKGSELLAGIHESCGEDTVVVGGGAGDDEAYTTTYQFLDTSVYTDAVVAVGFNDTLPFSVATRHGWLSVGTPKKVTRATGTIVQDIDGKPAVSLYEDYLGTEPLASLRNKTLGDISLSYPIGIELTTEVDGKRLVLPRAPLYVNDEGGMVFGDAIAEGTTLRMMVGNSPDALIAATQATREANSALEAPTAQAALLFSSHVRTSLFDSTSEAGKEVAAVRDVIGGTVPLLGFYTYFELAPLTAASHTTTSPIPHALHNDSIVVLLLGHE